jgi:hypothetical protein
MPIRINLKELFPADAQEITVDKLNFNFNKLLELGIGEQGLRGFSGVQGSPGPGGIPGPTGIRGNAWFLDAVYDPNTLTFTEPLIDGDFYLDSTTFTVWQYNGATWDFVFDLTAIINSYLAASPSPFSRGLGIGTPKDERFIVFGRRDDNINDSSFGQSNSANNDVLFLNNFNEDVLAALIPPGFDYGPATSPTGSQIPVGDLFTSLLTVYVDHRNGIPGRYHLEFGELYEDAAVPDPNPILTQVTQNFKMKYLREQSLIDTDIFNIAQFSVDAPDSFADSSRVFNAVFQFDSPRWNGSSASGKTSSLYFGSRYGLDEIAGSANTIETDGILFYDPAGTLRTNIGIAKEYTIANFPTETGYVTNDGTDSYFMLDHAANIYAIYLNSVTLQDGGNFIQLGTTAPRTIDTAVATLVPTSSHVFSAIVSDNGTLYHVGGAKFSATYAGLGGYMTKYSILNPNNPLAEWSQKLLGKTIDLTAAGRGCAGNYPYPQYLGTAHPVLSGVADMAIAGETMYLVNNQCTAITANYADFSAQYYRTYFQILQLNSTAEIAPTRLSRLGYGETAGTTTIPITEDDPLELNCAWRIKLNGNTAIVARNGLPWGTDIVNPMGGMTGAMFAIPADQVYTGGFAAVDITDPTNPIIIQNADLPLLTSQEDISSILDITINDNKLYALTVRQSMAATTGGTVYWGVYMDVYDISGLSRPTSIRSNASGPFSRMIWVGRAGSAIDTSAALTNTQWIAKSKYGAIAANDKYIFTGYRNKITIYNAYPFGKGTAYYDPAECQYTYSQILQEPLDFGGNPLAWGAEEIYDIKVHGNSLYVLAKAVDLGEPRYFVFKYDISGGLSNTTGSIPNGIIKVWQKELSAPCYRFEIIGKHIYAPLTSTSGNDANLAALDTLEFDGIYTSGAHIESLRADKAVVVGPAEIGTDLKVNNNLQVGGDSLISGNLSVSGNMEGNLTHVIVNQAVDQTFASSFGTNYVSFDTKELDTLSEFTVTGAASTRVFLAKNSGVYQFNYTARWYPANLQVEIYVITAFLNVTPNPLLAASVAPYIKSLSITYEDTTTSGSSLDLLAQTLSANTSIYLNEGDKVGIGMGWIGSDSGGSVNLRLDEVELTISRLI